MDVGARREVHERVAAPFAAPDGFLHLLVDAAGGGGVADVGVYLDEEVAAYDHGFGLGVVDVGRQDGAPGSDFLAHEFGRDVGLDAQLGAVHVLAYGHVLHLGRNDALLGEVHLPDLASLFGAEGKRLMLEAQVVEALVRQALPSVLRR